MRQIKMIYGGQSYRDGGSRDIIIELNSDVLIKAFIDFGIQSKTKGCIFLGDPNKVGERMDSDLEMEAIEFIIKFGKL